LTANDEVVVGRIAGAFGVHGELKCDPTSAGRAVFSPGAKLRCVRADVSATVQIAGVRPHKGRLLIRIDDVGDADAAELYSGALLYAPRQALTLRPGEYLDDDLVGCSVAGKNGIAYGEVTRVEHYPASDMLIVNGRMVPMVGSIVVEIDLAKRRIVVDPPTGLLD